MIRPLDVKDEERVCGIVNASWKSVYAGYVDERLLSDEGCARRRAALLADFSSGRLQNYVYEQGGQAVALLSFGKTGDADRPGAFEIWRIYVDGSARQQGIGAKLLEFAERQAEEQRYTEILIWAFRENRNAVFFYEKHGYVKEKELYLEEPYHAWGMRLNKRLHPPEASKNENGCLL